MLHFSRSFCLVWPLLAAASASAQTLPGTDGTPQLRRLPAATAAQLRQLPLDSRQLLREQLALRPMDDMQPLRVETDERGEAHERYQQTYRGVKVEHGTYTVHRAAGLLSGELKAVPATLSPKPVLSADAALQAGLRVIGATRYMWNDPAAEAGLQRQTGNPTASYRPVGELVIVEDYRQREAANRPLRLAWKFNIYAQQPESRAWVYVDARTGEVVLQDAIIKHASSGLVGGRIGGVVDSQSAHSLIHQSATPLIHLTSPQTHQSTAIGTFATRYVGSRQVATDLFNGNYRLRDYTRASGIETYNLRGSAVLPPAGAGVDFTDVDNNWTAAEFNNTAKDNAALDAHFGSTQVYDYWQAIHGRNSYDGRGGKLINYVHFRTNFDNASWDGTAMRYGDGGTLFRPLTALDVCAHETGHGVCQETAGLVYMNESGALNEGFSDIWGASVEYFTDPTKQTWIVGEDLSLTSGGLRSMSDPRSTAVLTPCPANYRGQLWNFGTSDNGGVHTNSGVLNHWYYILSVGKTGVNERGQAYSVTGLGLTRAGRIAFRAERLYLTSNSDFRSARLYTIQAAEDLYGANSPEVQAVTDAWFAVGLGNSSSAPAGAQAQCLTDDAPVVTATASATVACVGSPFTLTGTAVMPTQRHLRNSAAGVPLPDGATAYTAVPVYNSAVVGGGTTLQHGLEQFYTSYTALTGVRVRLTHARPDQVALRLAVTGSTGGLRYVPLAFALPTYSGTGPATLDITFADNATASLPATMSGNTLSGTFRPQTLLGSIAPGTLRSISLEALDGQVGTAGTVDGAELIFPRLAFDQPTQRWVGPGIDAAGAVVTVTPPAIVGGGSAVYRYTYFASDPYFGCTSSQTLALTVRQPLLVAAAAQPELCAGRGLAFAPVTLRVTQDDSIAGQNYQWSGPNGYLRTGKRQVVQFAGAGRQRYAVSTTIPGTSCTKQQGVVVLARRPVTAAPAAIDTVVVAGNAARLRSRSLENQLVGAYAFTGSVPVPDNNPVGIRIPLAVAGPPEGFFTLRGIRVTATHTYMSELKISVEAPDGTRVLLSNRNGGGGTGYQSTLFVDSVGARALGTGSAPFAGAWQVDEPTGFAALRNAPQAGTWSLLVSDNDQNDVGRVLSWSIETTADPVSWSGPAAFVASGAAVLSPVLTVPGHYRYIASTRNGSCTFADTVNVRVARALASRTGAPGLAVTAAPVPFGAAGFALHLPATAAGAVQVTVYDLMGRQLLHRSLPGSSANITLPEAGRLPSGVYQVRVVQGLATRMLRVTRE